MASGVFQVASSWRPLRIVGRRGPFVLVRERRKTGILRHGRAPEWRGAEYRSRVRFDWRRLFHGAPEGAGPGKREG